MGHLVVSLRDTKMDAFQPQVLEFGREELILQTFFSRPTVARAMLPILDTALFDNVENKSLVKLIRSFIHKYNHLPNSQELYTGLETTGIGGTVRNRLQFICASKLQPMDNKYCADLIEGFYREKKFHEILVKQAEHWHNHEMDAVRAMIPEVQRVLAFSLSTNIGMEFIADAAEMMRRLNNPEESIPTRIAALSLYTNQNRDPKKFHGGYYRAAVSLIFAPPNKGKTLCMVSDAAYAIEEGFNVLYVTLEMGEEKIWSRLAANVTGKPMWEFFGRDPDEVAQELNDYATAKSAKLGRPFGMFRILELPTTTTPDEINGHIDEIEAATGRKIDLLVVDYLGITKPNKAGHNSNNNMYQDGVEKCEQLRDISKKRRIATLSAVQFNRTGYRTIFAGMDAVEGSSGYNNTADLIFSHTNNDTMRESSVFMNIILKSRFGPAGKQFGTKCDYATMRWESLTEEEMVAWQTMVEQELREQSAQRPAAQNRALPVNPPVSQISGSSGSLQPSAAKGMLGKPVS